MRTSTYDLALRTEVLMRRTGLCDTAAARVAELRGRLEGRDVIVAVMGQFKRGKTTLVNTILGESVLPVGIVPVTSAVTRIEYGERAALVQFENGRIEHIDLPALSDYISEQKNPENRLGVSMVTLRIQCSLLENGMTLVDTPGVGSVHRHNSDTAYSFVKDSDAVIFMLSVDSPLNQIEVDFLQSAKEHAAKFYFAVNKIDTISDAELGAYLDYCRNLLCGLMGLRDVALFPISAKGGDGLRPLLDAMSADLESSAEDILADSVCIKLVGTIGVALSQIDLYCRALQMPLGSLDEKRRQLEQRLEALSRASKTAALELVQSADELIDRIQQDFDRRGAEMWKEVSAILDAIYRSDATETPRLLEIALRDALETELRAQLSEVNEAGLAMLKEGYEGMANQLGEQMNDMKVYLSSCVAELFGVEYRYETSEYSLTERSDFFIRINQPSISSFADGSRLNYILPKKYANKRVYDKTLGAARQDISCNLTNMVANYRYKLRESIRSFGTQFQQEATELLDELEKTLTRVQTDREQNAAEVTTQTEMLMGVASELRELTSALESEKSPLL